jgi:hypothetical protein
MQDIKRTISHHSRKAGLGTYSPIPFRDLRLKDDKLLPPTQVQSTTPIYELTWLEALGPLCLWVYITGYAAITASVSFLIFLWSSNASNTVWRQIILTGWLTRCISLSSSLLRIAIAFQAASATSIIAAILLQENQIRLVDAPAISFMRWANPGPSRLALLLPPNFKLGSRKTRWIWTTIFLLTLTTTISQISSTILLTDANLSQTVVSQHIPYLLSDLPSIQSLFPSGGDTVQTPYWLMKPNFVPTFVELHEPASTQHDGFYDTGSTFRGFIPIGNQSERTLLKTFEGLSTVLDARVVCMKPRLNFSISPAYDIFQQFNHIHLTGSVGVEDVENPYYQNHIQTVGFDCTAPLGDTSEWRLSACYIGDSSGPNFELDKLYGPPGSNFASPFLVFNVSGDVMPWQTVSPKTSWKEQEPESAAAAAASEWTVFSSKPNVKTLGLADPSFGVSLCFTPLIFQVINISASGGIPHTEAAIGWNPTNLSYVLTDVISSLGVAEQQHVETLSDRGHLSLDIPSLSAKSFFGEGNSTLYYYVVGFLGQGSMTYPNQTFSFCASCYGDDLTGSGTTQFVSAAIATLFSNITASTGHPALAFQAAVTTVAGYAYTDLTPLFSISKPAFITAFVDVIAPTQWVGLPVVLAVTVMHCIFVTAVLVVFLRSRKRSVIGSAWSALGQITQGKALHNWVTGSSLVDDNTVGERLRVAGEHQTLVGVDFIVETGEVELRKRE